MTQTANSTFKLLKWEEHPVHEAGDLKLTYSYVEYEYSGDMVGTSRLVYAMTYLNPDHAIFTGTEHFTGSIHGHGGSFVFIHVGYYKKGEGTFADVTVSPNTATGALATLQGSAKMALEGHMENYPMHLSYSL